MNRHPSAASTTKRPPTTTSPCLRSLGVEEGLFSCGKVFKSPRFLGRLFVAPPLLLCLKHPPEKKPAAAAAVARKDGRCGVLPVPIPTTRHATLAVLCPKTMYGSIAHRIASRACTLILDVSYAFDGARKERLLLVYPFHLAPPTSSHLLFRSAAASRQRHVQHTPPRLRSSSPLPLAHHFRKCALCCHALCPPLPCCAAASSQNVIAIDVPITLHPPFSSTVLPHPPLSP